MPRVLLSGYVGVSRHDGICRVYEKRPFTQPYSRHLHILRVLRTLRTSDPGGQHAEQAYLASYSQENAVAREVVGMVNNVYVPDCVGPV